MSRRVGQLFQHLSSCQANISSWISYSALPCGWRTVITQRTFILSMTLLHVQLTQFPSNSVTQQSVCDMCLKEMLANSTSLQRHIAVTLSQRFHKVPYCFTNLRTLYIVVMNNIFNTLLTAWLKLWYISHDRSTGNDIALTDRNTPTNTILP